MLDALATVGWGPMWGFAGVALTALTGWMTGKRNNKSAERQKEMETTPVLIKGYGDLLEDSKKFYQEQIADMERRQDDKITRATTPLQDQVTELQKKDAQREAVEHVLIKYISDTFEGIQNGTIPPIIPVPTLIASRFDKKTIDALLDEAAKEHEEQ